jgi:hypothetical protein
LYIWNSILLCTVWDIHPFGWDWMRGTLVDFAPYFSGKEGGISYPAYLGSG